MKLALLTLTAALALPAPVESKGKGNTGKDEVSTKIVGGAPLVEGEYPFLISVASFNNQFEHENDNNHACGASLVSPRIALSSAQCFSAQDRFFPRDYLDIGRYDLREFGTSSPNYRRVPICVHEGYDERCGADEAYVLRHPNYTAINSGLDFDYAKIYLPFEVDDIEPVLLDNNGNPDLVTGDPMISMGWGDTEYRTPSVPTDIPYGVTLYYVNKTACADIYDEFVTDNVLCAGSDTAENKGDCFGDGGGPIIRVIDGIEYQAGIGSFGFCGFFPSAYAKVRNVVDWILDTLAPSVSPTKGPTASPTISSRPTTSLEPTGGPSATPSISKAPTAGPSKAPTAGPSKAPTAGPTASPTTAGPTSSSPTVSPSPKPTSIGGIVTPQPTASPVSCPVDKTAECLAKAISDSLADDLVQAVSEEVVDDVTESVLQLLSDSFGDALTDHRAS